MTAHAAMRAESRGAASGFNFAVGYLRAAAEGGQSVDPAVLLASMTAHAERISAIWRDPADEHPATSGSDRGAGASGAGGAVGGGSDSAGHPRPAVVELHVTHAPLGVQARDSLRALAGAERRAV